MQNSYKKTLLAASIMMATQAIYAQDNSNAEEENATTEEVIVYGVRQSLKNSLDAKREAGNIVDAISAEEVGKLPDNNIAEALQRVTGVQIGRNRKGGGGEFQIRGLVNNRVEVNGRGRAVTGFTSAFDSIDEARASNFESTPSALYKRVEVHKTPQAKHVEGASGGTVKLVSWKPLDFKDKTTINLSAEGIDDTAADDLGSKFTGLFAHSFDVGDAGEIGVLLNIQSSKEINKYQEFAAQISRAEYFGQGFLPDAVGQLVPWGTTEVDFNNDSNFAVLPAQNSAVHDLDFNFNQELNSELVTAYMPNNFTIEQRDFETESLAVDFTVQWKLNDRFQLSLQYEESEADEFGVVNSLNGNIRDRKAVEKYVAEEWTRSTTGEEVYFIPASRNANNGNPNLTDAPDRGVTPYNGNITRYFISAGQENGTNNQYNQSNRPLGVRGDTDSTDRNSEFFFLEGKWDISDNLSMEFGYSDSKTERDQFKMQNRFSLGVDPARYTVPTSNIDPDTMEAIPWFPASGRQNRGAMNPTVAWNYLNGAEVPDIVVNLDYINEARAAQGFDPVSLTSPELYQFESIRAPFHNYNFGEQSEATLDFDWSIDNGVFSNIEFGFRRTEDSTDRVRYEQGTMFMDTYLASLEQGFTLLAGDNSSGVENKHRDAWGTVVRRDSIIGSDWYNSDADPNNDVSIVGAGNDYENLVALYAANAGGTGLAITDFLGGPGSYGIPANIGGGNIPREFLTPTAHTREGWLALFEKYFPGRLPHECGADEVCAHELTGINPETGEYYTQADRNEARKDDVGGMKKVGYFLDPEGGQLLEETTDAFYLQANIDTDIGIPLTGNVGVRYVKTDVHSFQRSPGTLGANEFGFIDGNASYSELLPSVNFSFEVRENMFVKVAASKTIERQNPSDLAFKREFGNVTNQATLGDIDLKIGNPGLKPTTSNNFDISWEWFFNDEALVSVAYFRKDQKNIIDSVKTQQRYIPTVHPYTFDNPDIPAPFWTLDDDPVALQEMGFDLENPYRGLDGNGAVIDDKGTPDEGDDIRFNPNDLAARNPNFDPTVDYTTSPDLTTLSPAELQQGMRIITSVEPRNVDDGSIEGWELSYQQPFSFLPSPFDGFGTVINATFIDSERDTGVQEFSGTPRPLNKLSDETYNIILYYEKFGFSARIAYNWRSEWRGGFADRYDSREFLVEDPDAAARNAQDPTILRNFLQAPIDGDEYENSLAKTDISISYDFEDQDVTIYLQGDDIFESNSIRYLESNPNIIRRFRSNGTVWRLGVSAKLGF